MENMIMTGEELRKKVEEFRAKGAVDLSSDEDLALGVMNLIGLEEHLFFTSEKVQKPEYLAMLADVREMRKEMMKKLLPQTEGETWCASKHLLSASMRLMEVGTKELGKKNEAEAKLMFDRAYHLFSLFWALKLKLVELKGAGGVDNGKAWTTEDIVSKLVDCCNE